MRVNSKGIITCREKEGSEWAYFVSRKRQRSTLCYFSFFTAQGHMSRKILAEESKNCRSSFTHGSMERRWSNSRDLRDGKLTDVLPLERQWEVCQLSSTLSSRASSLCPVSFRPPRHNEARHPGKCRAAERTGLMGGMRLPAHLLDLRNVTSCVTLQLATAPPRPSHVRG